MDAAQALADLAEISAQIEAAVLAGADGAVAASTLADADRASTVAATARELLAAAEEAAGERGAQIAQLEAATAAGSVFVVRDERRLVAAVTGPQPTAGLVFYDLKTCLRLLEREESEQAGSDAPKPARRKRKKEGDGDA